MKRLPEIFHKICRDFLHDYFRYRTSGYTNYGNLERQKQSIKILQLTSTRAFSSFRSWFKPNFECTKLIKVWVNGRHRYLKPQISFSFLLIIVVSQSSVRSFLAFNYWSYKTEPQVCSFSVIKMRTLGWRAAMLPTVIKVLKTPAAWWRFCCCVKFLYMKLNLLQWWIQEFQNCGARSQHGRFLGVYPAHTHAVTI